MNATAAPRPAPDPLVTRVFVVLLLWLSVLLGLGFLGQLEHLPTQLVPVGLFGSLVAIVLALRASPTLRAWLGALDWRLLVAWHIVRAPIGVWFLVEHAQGRLPAELALRAGWGDIASGLLALAILPLSLANPRHRTFIWLWNVLATIDIVMVVLTAQKLIFLDRSPELAAAGFPLLLLPWFVVPLVLVTHAHLFTRLRAARR